MTDGGPTDTAPARRGPWVACCLIAVVALFGAYSNHFDNGFHFDDSHVIVSNLAIRNLANAGLFFTDASTFTSRPENASYRPLLTLSYALDYRLGGGLEPRVFHRTQFALLLLLGAALVVLYRELADRGEPGPWNRYVALFAATLFCIHTANTETVNYLSSRSSLVGTLGVVLSFVVYLRFPRLRPTYLYLVPMLLCGLAKPLTVIFAPLLVVWDFFFQRDGSVGQLTGRAGWGKLAGSVLHGLPALISGFGLFVFLRWMEPEALLYATVERWQYAVTQPFVWLHYFRLFFVPVGLTADTDWRFLETWQDVRFLVGCAFIAVLVVTASVLSGWRRLRPAAFGLIWFMAALLPTSSVFPLSEVYNEHRIFFPYVGLAFAAIWIAWLLLERLAGLAAPGRRLRVAGILALVLLIVLGLATHRRNRVWADDLSLWSDVARKSPTKGRGLMNYGLALMSRGQLDEALELFERAEIFAPNYSILEVNLGIAKAGLGRDGEAAQHFLRAIQLEPRYGLAHFYYGRWLMKNGRGPEALERLEQALELVPWNLDVREALMLLYGAAGQRSSLSRVVASTLRIAPGHATALAFQKGQSPYGPAEQTPEAYIRMGRVRIDHELWVDAALLNRKATLLDPTSATAWNDLGWALGNLGFFREAVGCFRRAIQLDPEMNAAVGNLRWAETGAAENPRD